MSIKISPECAIGQSAISSINPLLSECNCHSDHYSTSFTVNTIQNTTTIAPENPIGELEQNLIQRLKTKNIDFKNNVS